MAEVAVVVPTFSRATLLPRAVGSARAAGKDVEVVVVDDASSDVTPGACRSLGVRHVRHARNLGLAAARNTGLRETASPLVCFLDDDDMLAPGDWISCSGPSRPTPTPRSPTAFTVGGTARPASHSVTHCRSRSVFWRLLEGNIFPVHSILVRRGSLESVGEFATDVPGLEDWDLWLRLAEEHHVVPVREVVAVYRQASLRSGQMTSNQVQMCRTAVRVQERALRRPRAMASPWSERRRVKRVLRRRLSDILILDGAAAVANGMRRRALALLLAGWRMDAVRATRPGFVKLLASSLLWPRSAP